MALKWKTAILVWIGILLYFGVGFFRPKDADLLLMIVLWLLLLAATIYTVVIWVRDRAKGAPERTYHLSAYPRRFLRFALDEEEEPKRQRRVNRQPKQDSQSDTDHS